MPYLPANKKRPWLPEPTKREHQGRQERSSLYNTSKWRKVREAQLSQEPLCAECMKHNRVTAANVCDHIQRYNTVKSTIGFFDMSNLQSLCTSCHNKKSANERHS